MKNLSFPFLLFCIVILFSCSSKTQETSQESIQKDKEVILPDEVEQKEAVVKKTAKDLKIVRSDKKRIVYKNDGTSGNEKYDIVYELVDEIKEESRIKIQIDQHLIIEKFNHSELSEEVMKEIMFNAYNLAREEYPQSNAYFQIIMYPSEEIANKKAGKWLALLNHINDEGLTIKYDYDKMNAFAAANNPNAKFFDTDGSHKALKAHIMNTMYAPNTFEHIDTKYTDNKDFLTVTMKFKATNRSGENKEFTVVADCYPQGNIKNLKEVK